MLEIIVAFFVNGNAMRLKVFIMVTCLSFTSFGKNMLHIRYNNQNRKFLMKTFKIRTLNLFKQYDY